MRDPMEMKDLTRMEPGVPMAKRPVRWNTLLPVSENLSMVMHAARIYERLIQPGSYLDEVAILAPGTQAVRWLTSDLVDNGWDNFNQAEDLVFTNPFGTRYQVAYSFFSHPNWPLRIEVMRMATGGDRGFSPLHQSLWYPNGNPPLVTREYPLAHLSYKVVPSAGQTVRQAFAREQGRLGAQGSGLVHAQTCQSTYGTFAYWLPADAQNQLYLKPRVNTRDEDIFHSMCTIDSNDGCLAECGQPAPCEHAPDGGNHPGVGQ